MFAWISLSKHLVLLRIAATRACAARQRWPGRNRAAPARRGVTEAPSGRERRARIIGADGEYQASKLAQARFGHGCRPSRAAAAAAADHR